MAPFRGAIWFVLERRCAEILTDCMVTQVLVNRYGRVTGVTFVHDGKTYKQEARVVILSSYVVETPRLLLHSANSMFPNGLANSSGWVGRAIMPHSSHDVYGKFDEEVRLYKGTPVLALTQEFYKSDPARGFARGCTLSAHGSRPVAMATGIARSAKLWGEKLRSMMMDYNYYGRITLVGEVLPNPGNCVTLSEEKDEYGIPRAEVSFSYGENDNRLIAHAIEKMKEIMVAAGGKPEYVVDDTAHLMGGCRMGNDPTSSVTNSFGQTHDIPNLFISGASLFVTSGGANPTNTVMALASRTADDLKEQLNQREI
jgi:choline dehydrogenase-like flavoprotein